jgi:mono/diheme cytochrome c family protein
MTVALRERPGGTRGALRPASILVTLPPMLPNALFHVSTYARSRARGRALALGIGLALSASLAGAQDSTTARPATPGVYTDEQAERGNGVFTKVCVECHTRNDMSGRDFRLNWNGRTVFELFERIRTTMPDAAPGSLTREEYADVTSYFLKLNGMPAGSMPMPADSTLTAIKLEIPPPPPSQLVLLHRMLRSTPSRAHARIASPALPASLRADHSLLFRGF